MNSPSVFLALVAELCASVAAAPQVGNGASRLDGQVEEIYIARNIRESRTAPTGFCAKTRTGFHPTAEHQYLLRSVATRAGDSRVIDADVAAIGRFHACIGTTPGATPLKCYAEGTVGPIRLTTVGDCRALKHDYPEAGITAYACVLDLRDLPTGYIGGQAATNTVASRNLIGEQSDPPGYTQPSIVMFRLWRRR